MASDASLAKSINEQLDRLVCQLADLEESRGDLEPAEYEELKAETMTQLHEFERSLAKLKAGNLSIVGDVDHAQMAIQAAIRSAFQTPEVIKMFAKKEPAQLRTRLNNIKRDEKLGKLGRDAYHVQAAEILTALKRLGEKLNPDEESLLAQHGSRDFAKFSDSDAHHEGLLSTAAEQIRDAQQPK